MLSPKNHRLNWKMILRVVNKQNNNIFVSELLRLVVYLSANCKVYGGGKSSFSIHSIQRKNNLLLTWKSLVYRDKDGRSFLSIREWLDLGNIEMKVNSPEFHFQVSTSTTQIWHDGFVICCLSGLVRNWIEGTVYFWNYK